MTVERSASISTTVVIGTVGDVGPARWRTEGEKTPTEKWELNGDAVMRLLSIRVDDSLAGSKADGTLVVWTLGGTIGCHEFLVGGYPSDIKTGQRFALFINGKNAPLPSSADAAQVIQMWPVNGDAVTTAAEGALPVAEIAARAAKELPPTQ